MLLHSIVSQVNQPIGNILKVEVFAAGSQVTVTIPEPLHVTVYCSHEGVGSDVKLAILVKQGLFNIFLDDVGPLLSVNIRV